MHGARYSLLASIVLGGSLAVAAIADPAPRASSPPQEGPYQTRWGTGEFSITEYGANAKLTFGTTGVMWGSLSNAGRRWTGYWVHPSGRSSGARECSLAYGGPTNPSNRWPHTITTRPNTKYWGKFQGEFTADGRRFNLSWSSCDDEVSYRATDSNLFIGNKVATAITSSDSRPGTDISAYHTGWCAADNATAIARLTVCYAEPLKPIKLTLTKDVRKGVTRVSFVPLWSDRRAIEAAINSNRPLPFVGSPQNFFTAVRSDKFSARGDSIEIMPPATTCRYDYWSINITDADGVEHRDNGVIYMHCGPGDGGPINERILIER